MSCNHLCALTRVRPNAYSQLKFVYHSGGLAIDRYRHGIGRVDEVLTGIDVQTSNCKFHSCHTKLIISFCVNI